jgi:5-formyltetrahydrofolate cyclo-ligase
MSLSRPDVFELLAVSLRLHWLPCLSEVHVDMSNEKSVWRRHILRHMKTAATAGGAARREHHALLVAAHLTTVLDAVVAKRTSGTSRQRRPAVAAYLPMTFEVDVMPFIEQCHDRGVDVYVPHVYTAVADASWPRMVFVELRNAADLAAAFEPVPPFKLLQLSAAEHDAAVPWGREVDGRRRIVAPAAAASALDVLVVPGVAFDATTKARLGKGGGYYDEFLNRCGNTTSLLEAGNCNTLMAVAVAFDDQVMSSGCGEAGSWFGDLPEAAGATNQLPVEAHDEAVHAIATPSRLVR